MNSATAPIIALSVSDGPDLGRFGYLESHLRQVLGEVLVTLLKAGLRVGYGGDLREGGYTRELFEALSAAYARSRLVPGARPAIVHYFAFPSWCTEEPTALLRHLDALRTTAETRFCDPAGGYLAVFATEDGLRRVDPASGDTRPASRGDVIAYLTSVRDQGGVSSTANALSGMRQTMAKETPLRVVASGRVTGYQGRMPGIIEEALLHAAAGAVVVALGAFGGASRDVAIALGLLPEGARVRYADTGESYYPALADLAGVGKTHHQRAEDAGVWQELSMLAEADDPMAIAASVLRVVRHVSEPGNPSSG
jgi:hypothetical protein